MTAIVAVPPVAASRLGFTPALPSALARALAVWRSGTVVKALVRYERAFWHDSGRSGMVMWRDVHGLFACDASRDAVHPALVVFVGGPLAVTWGRKGEAGVRGGPAGDLYIFLSVKPHEFYQRDGADLYCAVPISMTTAALGGTFDVATLDGTKSRVSVPEGTQAGKQFRLKGKGMPVLRSNQVGDLYIQIQIETPQKLTKRQRELLKEFEEISSKDNNPESAGFFTRMKEFFEG